MTIFPLLDSGAVTQYPATLNSNSAVGIVRFIDGADQRFLARGKTLRSWKIQLELLNENEIYRLERFFAGQQGDYSKFSFPDPFSGQLIPNCVYGSSELPTEYIAPDVSSTSFWVIETNG
jgi:hypothetical protein